MKRRHNKGYCRHTHRLMYLKSGGLGSQNMFHLRNAYRREKPVEREALQGAVVEVPRLRAYS